jgi:hypothetical protein
MRGNSDKECVDKSCVCLVVSWNVFLTSLLIAYLVLQQEILAEGVANSVVCYLVLDYFWF